MSENNSSFSNESMDLLISEWKKLENIINQAFENFEKLSMQEIIEAYYQVINVTSLVKFLRQKFNVENTTENKRFFVRIIEIEKYIDEKFNTNFHPLIMSYLEKLIENSKKNLKNMTKNQGNKTKEEVENQAKIFEKLRQMMSTKEFVNQYHRGLKN